MAEFRMPTLGADMEAGTLVDWLVKPGDIVKRGDIVAVVETQKGTIEIEIFQNGTVDQILVPEGAKVPVGAPLALVDGALAEPAGQPPTPVAAPSPVVPGGPLPAPAGPPSGELGRHRISPLARRIAEELHVDLSSVQGTGPGGAIQRADVERAAKEARAIPAPPELHVDRKAALRAAIAKAMARSKREIPHYYLGIDVNMKPALNWLEEENRKRAVTERLLYAALLLKAVALAAREVPEMNGFWTDDVFQPSDAVHVGVAISLRPSGLVAPAIHHTDRLSLGDLMVALRDLVTRARRGVLRSSEISDPTITVTNLGEQSVPTVFGVIYPPQVALVGFGTITERPWAIGGMLGIHPILTATLAADHRASDGHRGGAFLAAVNRLLQEPEKLR